WYFPSAVSAITTPGKLEFINPDPTSESFLAVERLTRSVIRIDSNGSIQTIAPFDSTIFTTKLFFLNDSVLIYEPIGGFSKIGYYNFISGKKKELFFGHIAAISTDRKYLIASTPSIMSLGIYRI